MFLHIKRFKCSLNVYIIYIYIYIIYVSLLLKIYIYLYYLYFLEDILKFNGIKQCVNRINSNISLLIWC